MIQALSASIVRALLTHISFALTAASSISPEDGEAMPPSAGSMLEDEKLPRVWCLLIAVASEEELDTVPFLGVAPTSSAVSMTSLRLGVS